MELKCTDLPSSSEQVGGGLCETHSFLAPRLQYAAWISITPPSTAALLPAGESTRYQSDAIEEVSSALPWENTSWCLPRFSFYCQQNTFVMLNFTGLLSPTNFLIDLLCKEVCNLDQLREKSSETVISVS